MLIRGKGQETTLSCSNDARAGDFDDGPYVADLDLPLVEEGVQQSKPHVNQNFRFVIEQLQMAIAHVATGVDLQPETAKQLDGCHICGRGTGCAYDPVSASEDQLAEQCCGEGCEVEV